MTTLESVNNHSVTDAHMNTGAQTRKKKAVGVSEEAFGLVTGALTHFYSDPIYATARETIANAIDACTAAGVEKRVDITVTGDLTYSSEVAFTDHGIGMSMDTLMDVFAEFGISTKRGDDHTGAIVADADEFTGEFGLGGKTPYSLSNTFTVLTERDGEATLGVFTRNNDDMGECDPFPQEPTGQNGTTVTVPLRRHQRQEMINSVKRVAYAMPQGSVTLNGDVLPSIYDTSEKIEHGRIVPDAYSVGLKRNSVYVLMAGLLYPLTNMDDVLDLPSMYSRGDNALILEAENHRYKPTPQRDLLRKTEKNRERLKEDLKELYNSVVDHYAKSLNDKTWLDAARSVRNIASSLEGIVPVGFVEGSLMWRGIELNDSVSVGSVRTVEDEETGYSRLEYDDALYMFTKSYGKGRSPVQQNVLNINALSVSTETNLINQVVALTGFTNAHNPSEELSSRKITIGINQLCGQYGGRNNELRFIMLDDGEVVDKEWLKIGGEDSLIRMVSKDELIEMGTTPRTVPGGRAATKYTVRKLTCEDGRVSYDDEAYTTAELREFAESADETLYVIHEKTLENFHSRLRIALMNGRTVIYLTGGQKVDAMLKRIDGTINLMDEVKPVIREAIDSFLSENGGLEDINTAVSASNADIPDWIDFLIQNGTWTDKAMESSFYKKFAGLVELRDKGEGLRYELFTLQAMLPYGDEYQAFHDEIHALKEHQSDIGVQAFNEADYPLVRSLTRWGIRNSVDNPTFVEHLTSYIDMVDSMNEEA